MMNINDTFAGQLPVLKSHKDYLNMAKSLYDEYGYYDEHGKYGKKLDPDVTNVPYVDGVDNPNVSVDGLKGGRNLYL